jgi:hypothetical protein
MGVKDGREEVRPMENRVLRWPAPRGLGWGDRRDKILQNILVRDSKDRFEKLYTRGVQVG